MKEARIFIGNINKCNCYTKISRKVNPNVEITYVLKKNNLHEQNVILMKTKDGLYAKIDGLNICELALIYNASIGQNLMKIEPEFEGDLYVDQDSLKVYENKFGLVKKKYR